MLEGQDADFCLVFILKKQKIASLDWGLMASFKKP